MGSIPCISVSKKRSPLLETALSPDQCGPSLAGASCFTQNGKFCTMGPTLDSKVVTSRLYLRKLCPQKPLSYLWLERNEGMDPQSSPYITSKNVAVSIFFSIPKP